MHRAALTLMALSLLSACADTVDPGVPAFSSMPYPVAPNGSAPDANVANANAANANLPFFTTDPAYFANPQPAYYNGGPVYLASAPGYASDVVYFVDSTRFKPLPQGEASVPHPAWAWDHAKAKESVRKLAALEPAVVGAGHAEPLRGENLRPALERAAEKY